MQLYLIRHAHALKADDDARRPLSRRGRQQIQRMVSWLRKNPAFDAGEFWHSPLVRSRDTAHLLARGLRGGAKIRLVADLEPDDDPARIARQLQKRRRPLAIVGHEPHLSSLATRLLCGKRAAPVAKLEKGAVLALERTAGNWAIRWLVSPQQIPRSRQLKK